MEEPDSYIPVRIDKYLTWQYPEYSRSYLQKLIRADQVHVNGVSVKANYKVKETDEVDIDIPNPLPLEIEAQNIPLDILYEDMDLLVVNKPKGMVVHPAAGCYEGTLVNALLYHCPDTLSGINGVLRPGIVHRIDKNTTGSLLVCKNDEAHRFLADQLANHSIRRRYRAIVHGRLPDTEGTINAPIGRDKKDRKKMAVTSDGKYAITHYKVIAAWKNYSYIECRLETGRTHQIRVHMKHIGHPLLGDDVYGPAKCPVSGLQGQTLHAMILGFIHPRNGEYMEFTAPLPAYFTELIDRLGRE